MDAQRGGRWRDHRQVINGILWRTENGAKWHQVPDRYGPWKTAYHRFSQWEQDGTWARIEHRLQADAGTPPGSWIGGRRPTRRSCVPTRTLPELEKGAEPRRIAGSPRDRSLRGGLTTKFHLLAEGRGCSLVIRIAPGQAAD